MNLLQKTFLHMKSMPREMWVLWSATFLNQLGFVAFAFLLLYLTQHLGLSLAKASFVYIAYGISLMISSFLVGNLTDRIGPEKVMLASLLGNSVIMFIYPTLHTYVAILFISLLWGFTYGAFRPASQTLVSFLSPEGEHKIAYSVYRLSLNLGVSVGPLLGGFLVAKSFPAIFVVTGIANIAAAMILVIGLRHALQNAPRYSTQLTFRQTAAFLKKDKVLLLFLLGLFPITMVFYQHESSLAVYLTQNLHFSYHFYGLLFTINTLIIVFFEIMLNVATSNWSMRLNFILGSGLTALGFLGFAVVTQAWQVILLTVIWTLGEMIFFPASSAFVAESAKPENRGAYMGLFSMTTNGGLFLGLWGGSLTMNYFGPIILWIICGLCWFPSLLCFMRIPAKKF